MSWLLKKADGPLEMGKLPGGIPAKPPMGMPGKSPALTGKPPMMPPGGPKTEKQDVATADSVIKALKALIAREKSEGEGKDVKKLETALKAVEDFKGGEKKEVEKEDKGEEKKEEKPEEKKESSY